jgi:hypothetical protein
MTLRSQRFAQLKKFVGGSEAAATALYKEEAARYGVTHPFTTQALPAVTVRGPPVTALVTERRLGGQYQEPVR